MGTSVTELERKLEQVPSSLETKLHQSEGRIAASSAALAESVLRAEIAARSRRPPAAGETPAATADSAAATEALLTEMRRLVADVQGSPRFEELASAVRGIAAQQRQAVAALEATRQAVVHLAEVREGHARPHSHVDASAPSPGPPASDAGNAEELAGLRLGQERLAVAVDAQGRIVSHIASTLDALLRGKGLVPAATADNESSPLHGAGPDGGRTAEDRSADSVAADGSGWGAGSGVSARGRDHAHHARTRDFAVRLAAMSRAMDELEGSQLRQFGEAARGIAGAGASTGR